jgi:hypothetical protein
MLRLIGPFIVCSLALANTPAIAQAGATPPPAGGEEAAQHTEGQDRPASGPIAASELCPTLEQAAAENGLPFDFPARSRKVPHLEAVSSAARWSLSRH